MAHRSKPTFPIPQEVIDAAEAIKGAPQRALLAEEIRRCLQEDDQSGDEAAEAILATRSFGEALEVAQEFVTFEITD